MNIIYHDIQESKPLSDSTGAVYYAAPEEVLRQADVISVHLPLTDTTHHFLDATRLSFLKATAIVVNTSRGPIIDEDALLHYLLRKRFLPPLLMFLSMNRRCPVHFVVCRMLCSPRTPLLRVFQRGIVCQKWLRITLLLCCMVVHRRIRCHSFLLWKTAREETGAAPWDVYQMLKDGLWQLLTFLYLRRIIIHRCTFASDQQEFTK